MPWSLLGNVVIYLLPKLITLVDKHPTPGPQKKLTVKDAILAAVEGAEGITGRDLFNDPEIEALLGGATDAIVALQDGIAKKAAEKGLQLIPAK